jgi:hypothetical protein
MALKLGTTTASLYLGSTPVAAYLGAEQVYSAVQAVTLYFNGAVDNDWAEVGNWWLDAAGTEPAGRLPASVDSAVILAGVLESATPVFLAGLTVNVDDDFYGEYTVSGAVQMLFVSNFAAINGSVTFGGSGVNAGTIVGDATFNGGARNQGTITGTATFNSSSSEEGGTINGNATFNGSSVHAGNVTGTATFNDSACNSGGTAGTFVPDPPPSCE